MRSFGPVVFIPAFAIACALAMTMYHFAARGKRSPILFSCLAFQGATLIWAIGYAIELTAVDLGPKWLATQVVFSGVCFMAVSFLIFALYYTDHKLTANRRAVVWLLVPPVFAYLMLLSNPYHHLFYREFLLTFKTYGVVYWVHSVTSNAYIITGFILIIQHSLKMFGRLKKGPLLLMAAILIPVIVNTLEDSHMLEDVALLRLYSSVLAVLLFTHATFNYRFVNVIPIALGSIVRNMREAVIVIDSFNKIVDYNEAFAKTICPGLPKEREVGAFLAELSANAEISPETAGVLSAIGHETTEMLRGEISLSGSPRRYFSVDVQPIRSKGQDILGRIVTFHEVTDYRRLVEDLQNKTKKLAEQRGQTAELAAARERNRIAREVHRILEHSIMMTIAVLEAGRITCRQDPFKAEEELAEAIRLAREGLGEIRRSLAWMASGPPDGNTIAEK